MMICGGGACGLTLGCGGEVPSEGGIVDMANVPRERSEDQDGPALRVLASSRSTCQSGLTC